MPLSHSVIAREGFLSVTEIKPEKSRRNNLLAARWGFVLIRMRCSGSRTSKGSSDHLMFLNHMCPYALSVASWHYAHMCT